ncbi:MAG: carbohydrate ABC transporter permease [Planctomycetota bacterium]|nr:carbohydrate ABC transporter permease [Planctomycetota bacterium]
MSERGVKKSQGRGGTSWPATLSLIVIALLFITPLVWMISTSFKDTEEAAKGGLSLLPSDVSKMPSIIADNYSAVWNDSSITFPIYLRNTLIVALLSVVGMVLSSAIVAYGFARIPFRGRGTMFAIVLATMMIPFPVVMGPLYLIFKELGWIGSLKPLWVPAWFGGAFNIFLLRQFFMGIPKELDEAATIDGCSHWGIFWRIIVPLSRPALVIVGLFHFIYVWNDFLAPLIFLTNRDQFTLALGLQMYQSKAGNTPWNWLMAASTMVVLPVLLVFLTARQAFVKGIAGEGLKA